MTASRYPVPTTVEQGKTYYWCACGQSNTPPFCDGSHRGTTITPVAYTAPRDKIVFFCGCKQTGQAPICDGRHKQL